MTDVMTSMFDGAGHSRGPGPQMGRLHQHRGAVHSVQPRGKGGGSLAASASNGGNNGLVEPAVVSMQLLRQRFQHRSLRTQRRRRLGNLCYSTHDHHQLAKLAASLAGVGMARGRGAICIGKKRCPKPMKPLKAATPRPSGH